MGASIIQEQVMHMLRMEANLHDEKMGATINEVEKKIQKGDFPESAKLS